MPFTQTKAGMHRLSDQLRQSREDLRPFRENRRTLVEEYVGTHYGGNNGNHQSTPRNLMEQAVVIYTMHLAGGIPQVVITADEREKRIFASKAKAVINKKLREIQFSRTMQRLVMEAFFSVGIAKVGLDFSGDIDRLVSDELALEPYVSVIRLDNWVQDMRVPTFEESEFSGDQYNVPLDLFKELAGRGYYARKAAAKVQVPNFREGLNEDGTRRTGHLSFSGENGREKYRPYVTLWDLWLPDEQLVVTVDAENPDLLLRRVEWEGPESGPYYQLGFQDVPDNPLPLPPAANLFDYHLAVNDLSRKMIKQAMRQKTTMGYRGGADGDASRGKDAKDGDMFRLDDPDSVKEYKFPGVDPQTQAFTLYAESRFDLQAGNLSTLGGLSSGAETLGQEQLLAGQASQRISAMQQRTRYFTEAIIRDIGTRWWQNPVETYRGRRQAGEFTFEFDLSPEDRESQSLMDFSIDVQPYSMVFQGPEQRLNFITQFMQGIILPALPLIQQQGGQLKMDKLLEIVADYRNMPELKDIIDFGGEPVPQQGEARQSPVTNRIEQRVGAGSGPTQQGTDRMMQQALSGSGGGDGQ